MRFIFTFFMFTLFASLNTMNPFTPPAFARSMGGGEVRGGDSGVCDPEKEELLQKLLPDNPLVSASIKLLKNAKFAHSCVVGSSQLVVPGPQGQEQNRFFLKFRRGNEIYSFVFFYQAIRERIPAGYRGHEPGRQDGTVLTQESLQSYQVFRESVPQISF